jgi:membrane protein implicated in regulation of membrane protease activity
MWTTWWVWVVAGFALGVLEVIVPGYIFLGFAIGAVLTGILIAAGILGSNITVTILLFALSSLAAWYALRALLGRHDGQVKIWHKDVND